MPWGKVDVYTGTFTLIGSFDELVPIKTSTEVAAISVYTPLLAEV
jgi:hypothetical protein